MGSKTRKRCNIKHSIKRRNKNLKKSIKRYGGMLSYKPKPKNYNNCQDKCNDFRKGIDNSRGICTDVIEICNEDGTLNYDKVNKKIDDQEKRNNSAPIYF